jgi:hypothetical protein
MANNLLNFQNKKEVLFENFIIFNFFILNQNKKINNNIYVTIWR